MKALSFAVLPTAACLALALTARPAAGADKDDLQGLWVATSIEINGELAPAREVKRTRFTFKGDKLLIRGAKDEGREVECAFKIGADKAPKQIDIVAKDKTLAGIYEVKRDELKVCFENGGKAENRPKQFATNREEERVLIVFKRQKP
jgi:uncharacterized protein (TIGR03067 family)